MRSFRDAGKLVLGICNGFQVMIKCGLLLEDHAAEGPPATLDWNSSGKFEDRWVYMNTTSPRCVFLRGIESMYVPVAHGEGQFVARSLAVLDELAEREQSRFDIRHLPASKSGASRFPVIHKFHTLQIRMAQPATSQVYAMRAVWCWASCRIPSAIWIA